MVFKMTVARQLPHHVAVKSTTICRTTSYRVDFGTEQSLMIIHRLHWQSDTDELLRVSDILNYGTLLTQNQPQDSSEHMK